jgi:hypothetical protein
VIRLPDDLTPSSLADWLEISLLGEIDEPHSISDAEIYKVLRSADADVETEFENLRLEVVRRSRLLGDIYPLVREGYAFLRRTEWTERLTYSFMLLVSLNQSYADLVFGGGSATRPAELFEFLTALALERYLGGSAIRIGAHRRDPVPAAFPAAVRYLAVQLMEECGYGELEVHQSGDDNVDVVAWLPHFDRQPSQAIVLAQCAIGTDWRVKRSEIDAKVWRRHIRWHTEPMTAFAIPFFHEAGNSWRETATRGGLIFDRPRISSLVFNAEVPQQLAAGISEWCRARLEQTAALALG